MARQAIRSKNHDHVVGAFRYQIAEAISGQAVQTCSPVAFIPQEVRFSDVLASLLTRLAQRR